jgi:uncharacterized protein YqhQ
MNDLLGLLLTFVFADLCFILSVFLLTDSIHSYSKILEYRQNEFYPYDDKEDKANIAHQRALASDDLSYFFARVGTFFLIYNLLLVVLTVTTQSMKSVQFPLDPILVIISGIVSLSLVMYCYRVSHHKNTNDSLSKAVKNFWDFRRWREVIKKLQMFKSN